MKEKLLAILHADTDIDIKVGLIEDLKYQIADKEIMAICNEYLVFMSERNQLLLDTVGLNGIDADVQYVTESSLWLRFKDYLIEKEKYNAPSL